MGKPEEPVHKETLPVVSVCFHAYLTPCPVSSITSEISLFLDFVLKMSRTYFAICFWFLCLYLFCLFLLLCFVFN
jgi:hypothetical protein